MKIGMILDKTFPPDPRVENEASALIKDGHEVFLFCLAYNNEEAAEEIKGIQIRRFRSSTLEYKLSALAYTLPFYTSLMSRKIRDFIVQNKVEVLHIHDMRIAGAVFKANKHFRLKTVLDLHDNFPEVMKEYPHLQKFPGKQLISPEKWKRKEEEFIQKADKVITVSNEFIEEVRSRVILDDDKIQLVPNTISSTFYENYELDDQIMHRYAEKFVLLYLGDTGIRRGLLTVINAIPLLKDRIRELKFVIVGSNSSDDLLKQEVKKLGIEAFVDFEGWQNMTKFPSYILASDVCLSPLNRSIQHDVAYANKIFQYMGFSKPVLVSDALAQKKLIERTASGKVHQEKDPVDFAEKVIEFYQDKKLRDRLGDNGRRFIEEEFVWEKVSANLCNVYKALEKN
jgi:glycosyltransferase involved in cell wall biosynthesis